MSRPPLRPCSVRSTGGTTLGPTLENHSEPETRWNTGPSVRCTRVGASPAAVLSGASRPARRGLRWPVSASQRRLSASVSSTGRRVRSSASRMGRSSVGTSVTMNSAASRVSG